jgi:hypothetical protein
MIKHTIELKPFMVPDFVYTVSKPVGREDGFREHNGIPLSSLSPETLNELCDTFKKSVFIKAGLA